MLHHGQCPGPGHAYDCHVIIVVSSAGDIRQTDTAFICIAAALCIVPVRSTVSSKQKVTTADQFIFQ